MYFQCLKTRIERLNLQRASERLVCSKSVLQRVHGFVLRRKNSLYDWKNFADHLATHNDYL